MATNYLQTKCNELTDIIRFKRPDRQQVEHIIKWLNIYCGHILCDTLIDYLIYWGYPIEAQINDYGVITNYSFKDEDIQ